MKMLMPLLVLQCAMIILPITALADINWQPADITEKQATYWTNVFASPDFGGVLEALRIAPEVHWPDVVSKHYASPLAAEQKTRQKQFQELAARLVKLLEKYHDSLRNSAYKDVQPQVRTMLRFRDDIASRPTYINFVLVDTLNRVLYAHLVRWIAKDKDGLDDLEKDAANLARYEIDFTSLARIANAELGVALVNASELEKLDQVAKYRALWAIFEGEGISIFFPKNLQNVPVKTLLDKCDFGLILWRYMTADAGIKDKVPLLIEYRLKAPNFSVDDSYIKIKSVVGEDRFDGVSLAQRLTKGTLHKSAVLESYFQVMRSGAIHKAPMFSNTE